VREGDHYVINGQKLWTSNGAQRRLDVRAGAHRPERQEAEGHHLPADRHEDARHQVRPIITLDGDHHTNEVFFDNVRVPVKNRIGEENKGWDYAKFLLGNERVGIARVGLSKNRARRAKRAGAGDGRRQAAVRGHALSREAGAIEVELKALEITNMRWWRT
jgi:alkylation response protein AidB-like acyl-CoA dehydrogenase